MKITRIFHSGFLVETTKRYFIFDYYKKEIPKLNPAKPVIVFASHGHADHYEPKVFELLQKQGIVPKLAILAKDIKEKRYLAHIPVLKAGFDSHYEIEPDFSVDTFHSTDAGVAYLVTCEDGKIYHAGDLHDWVFDSLPEKENRQMTGMYRHEIDKLKNISLDAAFLPLDPRQQKRYADGILYFLQNVKVKQVYPMHFWGHYSIIDKFLAEYPQYESIVQRGEGT